MTDFPASTVLGYPRIGPRRELKRALESYWDGALNGSELVATGAKLRAQTWQRLAELGLGGIPSNTFSFYDHVLDTAMLVGAVPPRYRELASLDSYFAMARGTRDLPPLRMTKWFDTNYHYIVPEISATSPFRLDGDKPVAEYREALALGVQTRPVLVGPVTFLLLAQAASGSPEGFTPLDRLDDLVGVYASLLEALHIEGAGWVQLDEPILVTDVTKAQLEAVRRAYESLTSLERRPRLLVATYFGDLGEALAVLAATPVEGISLDLVRGSLPEDLSALRDKTLVAGVVSGRDVWRTSPSVLGSVERLQQHAAHVVVSSSCSLLHVPYDVDAEPDLDPALRERLAFAEQKVREIVALSRGSLPDRPASTPVQAASAATPVAYRNPYPVRAKAQAAEHGLPLVPTTTIGSFPQTGELRRARAALAAGTLGVDGYETRVRAEIERVIRLQERLGLDVLVHGEPERNDMVQYFAEHLV
jgi:5-methyltetrahydropteroyltriglutamate--homocysteine methyltransferase